MITRIALKGYEHITLTLIDYIEITPKNVLMFILGTNGSGKSSLLSELTPYPGHHTDFKKGGYKIVEFTFEGDEYIAESHYTRGTGIHSLNCITTGEQFNPGGTRRVQIELIETMFGLDKDLIDVLVGVKRFTTMSVTERRMWLKRLCPVETY